MLPSEVNSVLAKLILTNNDGHFECFSLKNTNFHACLEARPPRLPVIGPVSRKISKDSLPLLPKCTQSVILQIDEAYKLEYGKEPETQSIKGNWL